MDSKQSGQLDPKLKEIYDRVMGFNAKTASKMPPVPTPPAPSVQNPSGQPQATIPVPKPQAFTPIPKPQAGGTVPFPIPTVKTKEENVQVFNAAASKKADKAAVFTQAPAGTGQKGSKMILIMLGLVFFFAAYTFIWLKFFKFKIPFLPF